MYLLITLPWSLTTYLDMGIRLPGSCLRACKSGCVALSSSSVDKSSSTIGATFPAMLSGSCSSSGSQPHHEKHLIQQQSDLVWMFHLSSLLLKLYSTLHICYFQQAQHHFICEAASPRVLLAAGESVAGHR